MSSASRLPSICLASTSNGASKYDSNARRKRFPACDGCLETVESVDLLTPKRSSKRLSGSRRIVRTKDKTVVKTTSLNESSFE